jgi:hypothetical protein
MPSVASAVLLIEIDGVAVAAFDALFLYLMSGVGFSPCLDIPICRYVLGAVETFLDAVPSAGFFQGAVLL